MSAAGMTRTPVTSDLAARRIVAVSRVALIFALSVATSIEAVAAPPWLAWQLGLLWLPLAAWLWFAEEGPADRRRSLVAYAADLGLITLMMWTVPQHADLIGAAAMPLAVVVAYRSGPRPALALVACTAALRLGLGAAGLTPPADVPALATAVIGTLGVITLIARALAVQRRDATSVRHFAERSEVILARSSEGVFVTDARGRVLQANPAANASLLDAEHDDGMVGLHCRDLELKSADGPLDCTDRCALAQLCVDGQDIELTRQAGEVPRPFLANASRLPGRSGSGAEYLHSFRDITRLRQADEAKTMFLATASHELKTPLTVIRGFTQILRATITDEQSRVALDAIDGRSAELVAIVDRLLLSSRIEAGRVELLPTYVDISQLLADRVIVLGNTIGRPLDVEVADDLKAVASADGLATALEHLLDNAAKYSPGGEPIHIRAGRTDDEQVWISITDHGIGMTPEQAAQCFDKFWQAEATDVRRFGGTGIGLYIVRSLIAGMGATIEVRSKLGEGTTFTVTLPTAAPADDVADDRPPPSAKADSSSVDQFMAHLGLPSGATK